MTVDTNADCGPLGVAVPSLGRVRAHRDEVRGVLRAEEHGALDSRIPGDDHELLDRSVTLVLS